MSASLNRNAPLEFPVLDLFRAMTTLWVLFAHITIVCDTRVFFLSTGWLAVEIFIVLSGFLMYLLLQEERVKKPGSIKAYYIRRYFRVAPSYYVGLMLYLVFREFYATHLHVIERMFESKYPVLGLDLPVGALSVIGNIFFLNGLIPWENIKILAPSWTLCLEMQYYLLAPILVPCLIKRPLVTMGCFFVVNAISNVLFGVFGKPGLLFDYFFPSMLTTRIFLFGVGGMLCRAVLDGNARNYWILAISLMGGWFLYSYRSGMVCIAFALVVLLTSSKSTDAFSRFVRWLAVTKPVKLMADWTYGIYLYQMFAMAIAGWIMLRFMPADSSLAVKLTWFTILLCLITWLMTLVTFHFVEKPARTYGHKLAKRITEIAGRKKNAAAADAGGEDKVSPTPTSAPGA